MATLVHAVSAVQGRTDMSAPTLPSFDRSHNLSHLWPLVYSTFSCASTGFSPCLALTPPYIDTNSAIIPAASSKGIYHPLPSHRLKFDFSLITVQNDQAPITFPSSHLLRMLIRSSPCLLYNYPGLIMMSTPRHHLLSSQLRAAWLNSSNVFFLCRRGRQSQRRDNIYALI